MEEGDPNVSGLAVYTPFPHVVARNNSTMNCKSISNLSDVEVSISISLTR